MTTWFTADLHLGHANIIRYCQRPFTDVADMDRQLVDRWNEVVQPRDTVWVLGDMAMGRISESLSLVAGLAGRKLLLAGNHDRCWSGHGSGSAEWVGRYLDAGFAEVHQGITATELAGIPIVMCHFPYRGDSQDEDRFVSSRPRDEGMWLLHGHVHDSWRQSARMINVGTDVWDYRPVADHVLVALMVL